MEILAENVEWGVYLALIVIISAALLFVVVGAIFIIRDCIQGAYFDFADATFLGVLVFSMAILSMLLYGTVTTGPLVTHQVVIRDFNEVFKAGYEIVDKQGEIYTIRKLEGE